MKSNGYILVGGGDFAVEVATYIADIARSGPNGTPAVDGDDWSALVCDIVSSTEARVDAIRSIQPTRPRVHASIDTVPDIDRKQVLICIGDPAARDRLHSDIQSRGGQFGTVVHPRAYVAGTAKIAEGCIVAPFVFIGPFAEIGANCLLNVAAVVGHDVALGSSTVVSPGASINGRARTGKAAFLGAGAIVNPGVRLGSFAKLSAGSLLKNDAHDGFLMHGNPAKGRKLMSVK